MFHLDVVWLPTVCFLRLMVSCPAAPLTTSTLVKCAVFCIIYAFFILLTF